MDLHVSLVDRRDLAGETYRQVRDAVLDGRLRPGDSLPPSRDLARQLSVSRTTVVVAYDRLISEGYVEARARAGTFVTSNGAKRRGSRPIRHALRLRHPWNLPSYVREWPVAMFDFRAGIPDASLFPFDLWRRHVTAGLRDERLRRGVYGVPAGHLGLRQAIARHLGVARAIRADADDVIVTNGAQQAIDLIARVLLEPRDRVAVEDPGYGPPRRLFESLRVHVAGVPVDDEGLIVDRIPAGTRLIYVTPAHQFPLGVTMSLRRRIALLAWATKNNAAVIEDDYDSEFRFGGRPVEPLHVLDTSGRVIYVGSFSKTMLPGLRLGFVLSPPSLRTAIESAKYVSDYHTSLPAQAALAAFIDGGHYARHVRRMRAVYEERHERLAAGLRRSLGDELRVVPSFVGLHLTATTTIPTSEVDRIVRRARDQDVACLPLSMFAAGSAARAGFVLGYGAIAGAQIDEGIRRLKTCFGRGPRAEQSR